MAAVVTPFSSTHSIQNAGAFPAGRRERYSVIKSLNHPVSREQPDEWMLPQGRNLVELVMESSNGRIPDLIPMTNASRFRPRTENPCISAIADVTC